MPSLPSPQSTRDPVRFRSFRAGLDPSSPASISLVLGQSPVHAGFLRDTWDGNPILHGWLGASNCSYRGPPGPPDNLRSQRLVPPILLRRSYIKDNVLISETRPAEQTDTRLSTFPASSYLVYSFRDAVSAEPH